MSITEAAVAKAYSIAEARDQLPALVHEAEQGAPISLTRRGKPVAVLISAAEYERLTAGRADFAEALQAFRARHDLRELELDQLLEGTRDRSVGREPDWG